MKHREFTCGLCERKFEVEDESWTQEKAEAEKDELFPGVDIKDCGVVCDDCFNKLENFRNMRN